MAKIITAKVLLPEDGADDLHPILVVEEEAAELGNLIADHGIEVAGDGSGSESNPHTHSSELEPDDSDSGEEPKNGYRSCMSELLARPEGSERLTQAEARDRFKTAAHECSERKVQEARSEQLAPPPTSAVRGRR